jgi:ankyrin repeat protein
VPSASLPPAPSLEQLRKQAKDLLRAHRAGDPGAVARVAAHDAGEALKLTGAQRVIAREHGFPSWPRLRAYVERVAAHGPDLEHAYHEDLDYYEGRTYGLHASARDGTEGAVAAFERWDAPVTEAGARAVVARRHGFASWAALRRHVASLRDSGEPFARAYRAVEAHDVDGLRAQLETFPDLAAAVGTNGNDLLGMAGATCDERLVRVLLDAGADPTHGNAHGWTPLHQAAYSNLPLLARMLLDEGVPVDVSARGDGGTPLVVALFWGHREVTEVLAQRGSGASTWSKSSSRPAAAWPPLRARTAPTTAPTAASRIGAHPTTPRRCSTRRWRGRHAATASRSSSRSSRVARARTPTSTAAAP